tara:strand:- start:154 stop:588 length:435 start_codon:yes stop_codon:yes gene_type:complete
MTITYYRADSVSSRTSDTRYVAAVHECRPSAARWDDGGWYWINAYGSTGGPRDTEEEAINALCNILDAEGWTQDKSAAQDEAEGIAARRCADTCSKLRKLRRKYKDALHTKLLGRGGGARAQVQRWIMGLDAVPQNIVDLLETL